MRCYQVHVACHELLGHGVGKLIYRGADGKAPMFTDPITGESFESCYEEGDVWNTKFGLLLEKSWKTSDKTTAAYSSHAGIAQDYEGYRIKPPKLMALHHPLDDLTRIVIKREVGGKKKFSEWNSNRHTILFTSTEPSICLTYDNVNV